MLRVIGHIYADSKDKFDTLVRPLEEAGLEVAYDNVTSATVIQEVPDEEVVDE